MGPENACLHLRTALFLVESWDHVKPGQNLVARNSDGVILENNEALGSQNHHGCTELLHMSLWFPLVSLNLRGRQQTHSKIHIYMDIYK